MGESDSLGLGALHFLLRGLLSAAICGALFGLFTLFAHQSGVKDGVVEASVNPFPEIVRNLGLGFTFGASPGFFMHALDFLEKWYDVFERQWKHPVGRLFLVSAAASSVAWAIIFRTLFGGSEFLGARAVVLLALLLLLPG